MSELYSITNLDGYANDLRQVAAEYVCKNFDDNLDDYVRIEQIINLVNQYAHGYDDQNFPIISEANNEDIYGDIVTWIHNAGLSKLAASDRLECAWDEELNEIVFWAKNHEQSNQSGRSNMESEKSDT